LMHHRISGYCISEQGRIYCLFRFLRIGPAMKFGGSLPTRFTGQFSRLKKLLSLVLRLKGRSFYPFHTPDFSNKTLIKPGKLIGIYCYLINYHIWDSLCRNYLSARSSVHKEVNIPICWPIRRCRLQYYDNANALCFIIFQKVISCT